MSAEFHKEHIVGALGLALMIYGHYLGLVLVPPEQMMGDVGRILYVHVPAAWITLVMFTLAFAASLAFLVTGGERYDWLTVATVEVGVLLNVLLLVLGSIFARPTWGVWWDWDPRLTASAIMLLTFVSVLVLRSMVDDHRRRALWTAVTTVVAYINIPITYFSVRWWRSVHQVQSSPETLSDIFTFALRVNAFAMLFVGLWFVARRWRIEKACAALLLPPPMGDMK